MKQILIALIIMFLCFPVCADKMSGVGPSKKTTCAKTMKNVKQKFPKAKIASCNCKRNKKDGSWFCVVAFKRK